MPPSFVLLAESLSRSSSIAAGSLESSPSPRKSRPGLAFLARNNPVLDESPRLSSELSRRSSLCRTSPRFSSSLRPRERRGISHYIQWSKLGQQRLHGVRIDWKKVWGTRSFYERGLQDVVHGVGIQRHSNRPV